MISRRALLGSLPVAAMATAAESFASGPRTEPVPARRAHPLDGISRENLKITDVKVTLLSCPIPKEKMWRAAKYEVWKSDAVLVRVFTDKGIVGIGEGSPYGGPEEMKKFAEHYAIPMVIGQNPFDVEFFAAWWGNAPEGPDGRPVSDGRRIWAGIDAACWDIIGKAKNMPVYKLLCTEGVPNTHIRVYASAGIEYAWYKRPEDLIDEALRVKEEGYTGFKFRIGTEWENSHVTMEKYIPLVRKLRAAVGPDFILGQESNMRLTLEQCLELCPVLEELNFFWFEEPVPTRGPQALDNYLTIKHALKKVKVSGGESRNNRFEFKEWIDRGGYDMVQADCNIAGVTEVRAIAKMAELKGKIFVPHNWHGGLTTMANAAMVAAIPNRELLELNHTYNPLKEDVFKDPLLVKRSYMDLPNKPGFGMELAADLEKKFPYLPGYFSRPNPDLPPA